MNISGVKYNKLREALTADKGAFLHLKLRGGGNKFQELIRMAGPAAMEIMSAENPVPEQFVAALLLPPDYPKFGSPAEFRAHMGRTASRVGWSPEECEALGAAIGAAARPDPKSEPPAPARPTIPTPAEVQARTRAVEARVGTSSAAGPKGLTLHVPAGDYAVANYLDQHIVLRVRADGVLEIREAHDAAYLQIPEKSRGEFHGAAPRFPGDGHPGSLCF